MLTTSCPKCEKEVTLPLAARPESKVRCPLCDQEYTLHSVFAELPPLLELLDAPVGNGAAVGASAAASASSTANAAAGERGAFDFGGKESSADGDIALEEPVEKSPSASAFNFGEPAADAGGAATAGKASSGKATTARPARKKKQANPAAEIVKVILGGLVALPIAQLILWWLPGDWKRDPVGLAPNLPAFLSFLAPESLRNPDGEDETDGESTAGEVHPGAKDPLPKNPLDNLAGGEGDNSFGRDGLGGVLTGEDSSEDKKRRDNRNGRDGNGGDDVASLPFVEIGDLPGTGGEASPPAQVGPKNPPKFDRAALGEQLKEAKLTPPILDVVNDLSLEADERLSAAAQFTDEMSKLAHMATYTPDRPAGFDEHFDDILYEIEGRNDRDIVAKLADKRFGDKDRQGDGILLAGTVREVQKHGQLFETKIELASSKRPILVYSRKDPAEKYAAGDNVFILGAIIKSPKKQLAGYQGPDEPVVWSGYVKKTAAADSAP